MDKYKIELQKDGKYHVLTRDHFWQRWKPYLSNNEPVARDILIDALRAIGSAWWKKFYVRVDSIGVF